MSSTITHRPLRHWHKVTICCPPSQAELVGWQLTEISGNGIETMTVEHGTQLIAYLDDTAEAADKLSDIETVLADLEQAGEAGLTYKVETIAEEDWSESWKENYQASRLSPTFTVSPSWQEYSAAPGEQVIYIDPGLAFGTGLHPSTRLALAHVEDVCQQQLPNSLLDVGTGTGILAIAGGKLGIPHLHGLDIDQDALVAAKANCQLNNCHVELASTPLDQLKEKYELIIANITADVLRNLAPELQNHLQSGGYLILAGLLAGGQATDIANLFQEQGLTLCAEKQEDEWSSLLFHC